jgi:hypothetical protein
VNVRGTLREPRLSFFSEPSVPQSQIVSLLLAGRLAAVGAGAGTRRSRRPARAGSGGQAAACWPRSSAPRSACRTSASNPDLSN